MTTPTDTESPTPEFIAIDDAAPGVRRITLNRPEKRNAINNGMRAELFAALEAADVDDAVHVTIIRGAGPCFSSGYDLKRVADEKRPYYTAGGDGSWSRHVTEGWVHIWDLAKPVIAQVHGYAMAGGTELVAACDLVYVATDATFSYPVVRVISPPDFQYHPWLVGMRNAMELVLTGDPVTGDDAVRMGLANRAFPADELDARVVGDRGAHRGRARGAAADQQAQRAPGDGDHGDPHRHPRRVGTAGPRQQAPRGTGAARGRRPDRECETGLGQITQNRNQDLSCRSSRSRSPARTSRS